MFDDESDEINHHDEAFEALGAIAEHDSQTVLGISGILDGTIDECIVDLTAEQKLTLIENLIAAQAELREPLFQRLEFAAMMLD